MSKKDTKKAKQAENKVGQEPKKPETTNER
jgi:hypothetical protein